VGSPRHPSNTAPDSKLILRDYRPSDFKALWQLDQLCFTPEIAYTEYELQQFIEYPGAFTLVAEDERARPSVQGFILTHVHKQHGHIITIDVRDTQRRTGLGSRLLQASEDRLRQLEREAVVLEVAVDNLAALTFYKRHGFAIVKTIPRYYSNGLDALKMTKPLALD
jgi:[ribosomal protein S18]-alanine N-acetyltransferase